MPQQGLYLGGELLVVAEDLQGLLHAAVGGEGLALQLLDDGLDLLGGVLGTGSQQAHFVGHHRKAAAAFTGAGRLDGGVEASRLVCSEML